MSYGFTFYMGFLNYYLTIGLSFWAIAVFWRGKGWERATGLLFLPPIATAHSLGLLWLAAACLFIGACEKLPRRYAWIPLVTGVGAIALAHMYLLRHYQVTLP